MINREIVFERNATGSYMKIPANIDADFDERVMARKKIPGILPMEKTFINGAAQYWYNISGKQSLDLYCRVHDLAIDMIEKLIISICNQLEILEWNLLDLNSLVLDMELIFISSDSKEFIFMVYPGAKSDIRRDFRQLMEILITKVDHKDMQAVHSAYAIYEKTLDDTISLLEIRDAIVLAKENRAREVLPIKEKMASEPKTERIINRRPTPGEDRRGVSVEKEVENTGKVSIMDKIKDWLVKLLDMPQKEESEKMPMVQTVVYDKELEPVLQDYPTVLLSEDMDRPKGILIYDGTEDLVNIVISKDVLHVGKGKAIDIQIDRDTISHYHAKLEREQDRYYIQDLNSKNGTFVNHELIAYKERRQLKKNDLVAFANIQYRFS